MKQAAIKTTRKAPAGYVTKAEFNSVVNELREEIARLEYLKRKEEAANLDYIKKVAKYYNDKYGINSTLA